MGFQAPHRQSLYWSRSLQLLKTTTYFYFLDVKLPDLDSTSLIEHIRNDDSRNKEAILMMSSGQDLDEMIKEYLNQKIEKDKVDIFLLKPFNQRIVIIILI